MPETIGDQPVEPEYEKNMQVLATVIDELFNGNAKGKKRKVGFCLMVYAFGDTGRVNYVSNSNREDVIQLLKDQIKRLQKDSP